MGVHARPALEGGPSTGYMCCGATVAPCFRLCDHAHSSRPAVLGHWQAAAAKRGAPRWRILVLCTWRRPVWTGPGDQEAADNEMAERGRGFCRARPPWSSTTSRVCNTGGACDLAQQRTFPPSPARAALIRRVAVCSLQAPPLPPPTAAASPSVAEASLPRRHVDTTT